MPRLRQVPRAEVTSPVVEAMYQRLFDDRDPVAEPGTATGTPGNWWTVFALVPDVLEHSARGFGLYASKNRLMDPVKRELGQTRAGWLAGSQFVFSQHCKACRALGVSDLFEDDERALLAYTDALVLGKGRVDDGIFTALKSHFTDEQILEFTYITMLYDMHAVMTRALRLEWDDRDDPIVEIAAPDGWQGRSLGRDIALDLDNIE